MYDVRKWLLRDMISVTMVITLIVSIGMEWHLLLSITGLFMVYKLFNFAKTYEYWQNKSRIE